MREYLIVGIALDDRVDFAFLAGDQFFVPVDRFAHERSFGM
jgi:hypothetical protein